MAGKLVEYLFASIVIRLVFGSAPFQHYVRITRKGGVSFDAQGTLHKAESQVASLFFRYFVTKYGEFVQLGTLSEPGLFQIAVSTIKPFLTSNVTSEQLAIASLVKAAADTYELRGDWGTLAERDFYTRKAVIAIARGNREQWVGQHGLDQWVEGGSKWEFVRDFAGPYYH